jgi:predicted outer membrane repeat protein
MTDCTFTDNRTNTWGGGLYASSIQDMTDCTFIGNTAGSSGGGMVIYSGIGSLTGCTFTGNTAGSGGALYSPGYDNNLIIINSTISGNTTTNSSDGALYSEGDTYLIHTTITDNKGGGLFAKYDPVYLYNCVVSGNTNIWNPLTPYNIGGRGIIDITTGKNLVEGHDIPGTDVKVYHRQVFGPNTFDKSTGMHKVLTNGIAAAMAEMMTEADVSKMGLNVQEHSFVLASLFYDQAGDPRTGPNVTYGAAEGTANRLVSVSVVPDDTRKTEYELGDTIDIAGTKLTLVYSDGTKEDIQYDEPGVTNDLADVDTDIWGKKNIHFIFLGVSTTDETCLIVKVNGFETETALTFDVNLSDYGKVVTFTAEVTSPDGSIPTGTVSFYDDGLLLGKALLDNGTAVFSMSSLSGGTHAITARYEGDDIHEDSTSNEVLHEVIGSPPQADYTITAVSDSSTTITPEGSITVQKGDDQTFIFSADQGYYIGAVIVDGARLPQEQIALGYYTFRQVLANHTISVEATDIRDLLTLDVEIVEGKGRVEYSVNGSEFTVYTSTVILPMNANIVLRAYADGGYAFKKWNVTSGTRSLGEYIGDLVPVRAGNTSSEVSFYSVNVSVTMDVHFGSDSFWDKYGLYIGILAAILAGALLLFFRRSYEVIKATGNIIGKDRARRKRAYHFEAAGTGTVSYKVGEDGRWKTLLPNSDESYTIPKEDVVGKLTIEQR